MHFFFNLGMNSVKILLSIRAEYFRFDFSLFFIPFLWKGIHFGIEIFHMPRNLSLYPLFVIYYSKFLGPIERMSSSLNFLSAGNILFLFWLCLTLWIHSWGNPIRKNDLASLIDTIKLLTNWCLTSSQVKWALNLWLLLLSLFLSLLVHQNLRYKAAIWLNISTLF